MNILALDLGTNTGWASCVGGVTMSGVQSFTPGRFEGAGMRFLRFNNWLNDVFAITKFDAIYFEEVRHHVGIDAAHAYGGYMAVLTAWCELRKIPHAGVSVGIIKRHWTGKGNANKAAMIAEAKRRGFPVKSDDEADSLAILDYAVKLNANGLNPAL